MAMTFLPGEEYRRLHAGRTEEKHAALEWVVRILEQVSSTVHEAHTCIVHRD